MAELFSIQQIDRDFYEDEIRGFLPERIIDIHTHVYPDRLKNHGESSDKRTVTWPSLVAKDNPIEDLQETYRLMLPGKEVTPMIFSSVKPDEDFEALNGYISEVAAEHNLPSLIFARPDWAAEELEKKIQDGGFFGAKVYLNLSPATIPQDEIAIFDFLPHHQLEVLDRHGWIVMLHIPRKDRLRDPTNLEQILEIEERYRNLHLIIAHVGRAYCDEDVGNAFEVLGKTERLVFDFSANTNASVFERCLRAVGPKRMLFGSDMPILRMRMRRICEDGRYINLVPRGLYGDVSADPNMREVDEELSFFLYEEINAMRTAAAAVGLSSSDVEDMFYNNAREMLDAIDKRCGR